MCYRWKKKTNGEKQIGVRKGKSLTQYTFQKVHSCTEILAVFPRILIGQGAVLSSVLIRDRGKLASRTSACRFAPDGPDGKWTCFIIQASDYCQDLQLTHTDNWAGGSQWFSENDDPILCLPAHTVSAQKPQSSPSLIQSRMKWLHKLTRYVLYMPFTRTFLSLFVLSWASNSVLFVSFISLPS